MSLEYVLDASALLALLNNEPGGETVESTLREAAISSVNLAEVLQKSLAREVDIRGLREDLESLGLRVTPFDTADAETAAKLWTNTKTLGLSLGDRACLALAKRLRLPAVTADSNWRKVEEAGIRIELIR